MKHLPAAESVANQTLPSDAKGKAAKPWQRRKSYYKEIAKKNLLVGPTPVCICGRRWRAKVGHLQEPLE